MSEYTRMICPSCGNKDDVKTGFQYEDNPCSAGCGARMVPQGHSVRMEVVRDNTSAQWEWRGKQVRILSTEHRAWWRPGRCGYTDQVSEAGIYDFDDALSNTRGCGPEKGIVFEATDCPAHVSEDGLRVLQLEKELKEVDKALDWLISVIMGPPHNGTPDPMAWKQKAMRAAKENK